MGEIATLPAASAPASRPRPSGIVLTNLDDALRFSTIAANSGLLPKSFYSAGDPVAAAFCAVQLGAEVGLSPMASIQNIAVINNKPGLYGPAMLAVVEASGQLEDFDEGVRGEGDQREGWCFVKRFGRRPKTATFSMADARRAKLIGKAGPWTEYPDRMLLARARSFALRDTFPDILAGLANSVEELQDTPAERPLIVDPIGQAPLGPRPAKPAEAPPAPKPPKPPIRVKLHDGTTAEFPRTGAGLQELYDFLSVGIVDGHPEVVGLNNELLDAVVRAYPAMADDIAELRAAAAMAMAPPEPEPEPEVCDQASLGAQLDEFGLPPLRPDDGQEVLPTDPP